MLTYALVCVLCAGWFVCGWLAASTRKARRGGYLPSRAYSGSAYPSMPHHGSAAGIGSLEGCDRGNGLLPYAGSDD